MTDLLDGLGSAGPVLSNLPVLAEYRTKIQGKPARIVLYDRLNGRRTVAVFFLAGANVVLLFVEGSDDLNLDTQDVQAFVGSVSFTAK